MGADQTQSLENDKSVRAANDVASMESVVCPICGNSFVPRTQNQSLCGIHCFVAMRRKRGVYHRAVNI